MTSRARAKQRRREDEAAAAARAASLEQGTGREPRARETGREGSPDAPKGPVPARGRRLSLLGDVGIVLATFAAASALAAALGAANFGTALSFGQIGFALALAYVLVRRR